MQFTILSAGVETEYVCGMAEAWQRLQIMYTICIIIKQLLLFI